MDSKLIEMKKKAAELIKLLLENKYSVKDVLKQWPDSKEDGTLNKAFRMVSFFNANYQSIEKNKEYLIRSLTGLKKMALKLDQEKERTPIEKPFSFYEKISKPLSDVDDVIFSFAKKIKATVLKDYRENIARLICWRDKRVVKYISIWFLIDPFVDDTNEYEYLVTANAYKSLPFFIRQDRFDVNVRSDKRVGTLKSPIQKDYLENLLNKAYDTLKPITRDMLK
jgi:hypothetical protein